jgi:hypothetical protein
MSNMAPIFLSEAELLTRRHDVRRTSVRVGASMAQCTGCGARAVHLKDGSYRCAAAMSNPCATNRASFPRETA